MPRVEGAGAGHPAGRTSASEQRRVSWLVGGRVVVSTALLGSATLVQIASPGAFPVNPFYFLIGLTYGLSVVYLVALRYVDRWPWLVDVQLWLDAVLVSLFILVTGGIRSDFSSLYLLPILAASTLRARTGALQVAALSAMGYFAIVASQYLSVDEFPRWVASQPDLPSEGFAQYVVATNTAGFTAVAVLAGSLAENLRSAGAQLADASETIADLRAFNAHVIDSLVSGLVTTDGDWHVATFNRAAAVITGVPVGEAVGRDVRRVLSLPESVLVETAAQVEARGRRADYPYTRPDGRTIDLGITAAPLRFPDGRGGFLFTFQDVTDVKRLERESGRRERLAAVGEMAAGIAHEIRNPLASISGSMQVLRSELRLSGEQAELMDIVLKESERLNDTVRSFLDYARPQRSERGQADVCRVVRETGVLLQSGADARLGHVVDVDVPAAPLWVGTDDDQVRQIVWNLATNGLRAMADGGVLRMRVRPLQPDIVEIAVEDRGCGIPPDELDKIFLPFHTTFERGTGLGLATVHRVVTELKGVVHVESAVGRGTTMRVRLPLAHVVQAPPALAEAV